MTEHITAQDLNRLCARTLPAAELVAATAHMAECAACHEQFRAIIERRRGHAPISFSLAPEIWLQHEHLDYELLQTYTENTLPAENTLPGNLYCYHSPVMGLPPRHPTGP